MNKLKVSQLLFKNKIAIRQYYLNIFISFFTFFIYIDAAADDVHMSMYKSIVKEHKNERKRKRERERQSVGQEV